MDPDGPVPIDAEEDGVTGNLGNLALRPLVGFNACSNSYCPDQLTSGERVRTSDT